ncbi:MAG TPA: ABC transporter ATP-binding protein [Vicinamibacterales bacterium]|nr:ABC transporter ATP-binding protein [Vicinamibacterales bacterium]
MLDVSRVSVRFGEFAALTDVSLSAGDGEIVVLLGANGAGKSTLFRALIGLVPLSAGTIRYGGEDVTGQPAHAIVRRGIALAPEGRHLFPQLSVKKNLLLGAYTLTGGRERVAQGIDEACALFPVIRDKLAAPAGALSGGQQQMVALARALMARPRLLLLDEPSLGLAPLVVQQLLDAIRAINAGGATILLAEQNAQAALGIATRGYVLENGRVVLEGARDALVGNEGVKRAYLGM